MLSSEIIPGRGPAKFLEDFPGAELMDISQLIVESQVDSSGIEADLLTIWLSPYLRKVILCRHPVEQMEFDGIANPLHHTNVCCTYKEQYTEKQLHSAVRKCLKSFVPFWGLDGRGGAVQLLSFREMPAVGNMVNLVRANKEILGQFEVTDVLGVFEVDGIKYGELFVDGLADNPPVMFKVTR